MLEVIRAKYQEYLGTETGHTALEKGKKALALVNAETGGCGVRKKDSKFDNKDDVE